MQAVLWIYAAAAVIAAAATAAKDPARDWLAAIIAGVFWPVAFVFLVASFFVWPGRKEPD